MRWRWNVITTLVITFAVGFALGVGAGSTTILNAAVHYYPDLLP